MSARKELDKEWREAKRRRVEAARNRVIAEERALYRASFKAFVRAVWENVLWPGRPLVWNWHLDIICEMLEAVFRGEITRLIVNVPPRSSKTTLVSICYQVWVWLHDPSHQFLCLAHSSKKARADAVKARNIIRSMWFRERWGDVFNFAEDSNAKERFENNHGGHRISFGMTTMLTGENADTIVIDDPHDIEGGKTEADQNAVRDNYDDSISQRLNDPMKGSIILIMQRIHPLDLCGHILANSEPGEWVHLMFAQEYEPDHPLMSDLMRKLDPRKTPGELLWPERFPRTYVNRRKKLMTVLGFSGQHQQRPTPAGGSILKEEYWRPWPPHLSMPEMEFVLHSWDTAYSEEDLKKNARSAMTSWGIFWNERRNRYCIMLLRGVAKHLDYPKLRKMAKSLTRKDKPDDIVIEKKASGISLIQDLRQADVPVSTYLPDKSKTVRAYAVQSMFESGMIYYPEGKRWAEEVIDEAAAFPNGLYADYVDTITQALIRIRNMHFFKHPEDMDEDDYEDQDEIREMRREPDDEREDQPAYG